MQKYKIGNIVRNTVYAGPMWAILYVGTKHGATPWILCRNLLNGEEKWFLGHHNWEVVA